MYNLYRKSIVVAGLSLLLFFSCTTVKVDSKQSKEYKTLDQILTTGRDTLIYLDFKENMSLLGNVMDMLPIEGKTTYLVDKSNEIFLAYNEELTNGFDAIINGEFSKWKSEMGLSISFQWKKYSDRGLKYWKNKDGLKLYFAGNETVIISTGDIVPIISRYNMYNLEIPASSIYIMLPLIKDEQIIKLSNGFIKGGIESMNIFLDKSEIGYDLEGVLGLESDGKARALTRLIKIFLKVLLSGSIDPDVTKIGDELNIEASGKSVIINNVKLKEEFIADFVNSIMFLDGEADR